MSTVNHFSDKVANELKCYVYRLIDPRNGATFYVGRGQGNRVFAHIVEKLDTDQGEEEVDLKLGTIRAVRNAGFEVQHVIHRHGLDAKTAAEVEAALIDAYPGLTNAVKGSGSDRGVMHANEIVRKYEAQPVVFYHNVLLIDVGRTSDDRNLYDAVRYAWSRVGTKGMRARYALAVRKGLIIGAFEPDEWLKATPENFPGLFQEIDRDRRWGFVGREAPDEIRGLYVGKRAPDRKKGERWSTRYQPAKTFGTAAVVG